MQALKYTIKQCGFSLLELLIVLVIMSLLLLLTYPSYQQHILKVKRSEAQQALWQLATKMEQYAIAQQSYSEATMSKIAANPLSAHGYYSLRIVTDKLTANYYALEATPNFNDDACGTFILDQTGHQAVTGQAKDCW